MLENGDRMRMQMVCCGNIFRKNMEFLNVAAQQVVSTVDST